MRLLAIETSSPRGSLCLCEFENGKIKDLTQTEWEKQSSHSEVISEIFLDLLRQKSWTPKDLTHIATGIGPGSFTGIRVGLNFAKSLAYGLGLPVLQMNSLEVLSVFQKPSTLPVLCIVNAFRNQIFAATYASSEIRTPELISPTELDSWITKPHLCVGDAYDIYHDDFSPELLKNLVRDSSKSDFPQAKALVLKVEQDFGQINFCDWKSVNPLYIRAASAEEKLKGGSLKPSTRF